MKVLVDRGIDRGHRATSLVSQSSWSFVLGEDLQQGEQGMN